MLASSTTVLFLKQAGEGSISLLSKHDGTTAMRCSTFCDVCEQAHFAVICLNALCFHAA